MLKDLIADNLLLLICGTAAGRESAERGVYYAKPSNRFWRILHETGLTPRRLAPTEYSELLDHRIGLTDIVKGQAGNDADIDFAGADAARLEAMVRDLQPRVLCFNGKAAAKAFLGRNPAGYGLMPEQVGETALFTAPSTSGGAAGYWDAEVWHELGRLVRRTERPAPRTIEQAVEYLLADLTEEQKAELLESDETLWHFGIAMYVRNEYGLWEKGCPLLANGSILPEDPDTVSNRIVRLAQQVLGERDNSHPSR